MEMFLVWKKVNYDNGFVYLAIFDNIREADKYVKNHSKEEKLYIRPVHNGDNLIKML